MHKHVARPYIDFNTTKIIIALGLYAHINA
jgi:hypothetical protein